jgi:hypothetical protein
VTLPAAELDVVTATADLIGRTGAREFKIGYDEDPPHLWYVEAFYKGARIWIDKQPGPAEACDAIAKRILTGAKCKWCGKLVALSERGAFAFRSGHLVDGTEWTAEQAFAAGQCLWWREGATWLRGCEPAPAAPKFTREQRRAHKRRRR